MFSFRIVLYLCWYREGNNTILRGCVNDLGVTDIISSETEHHCVLHTLEALKAEGLAEIHYVKLNDLGHFDLEDLDAQLKALNADGKKVLISLMHSNNEIGTMMDIKKVGQIAEANDAFFHSDTVQTLGSFQLTYKTSIFISLLVLHISFMVLKGRNDLHQW